MKNERYSRELIPAADSPDGETPLRVVVTEENNGLFLWLTGYGGTIYLENIRTWTDGPSFGDIHNAVHLAKTIKPTTKEVGICK